MTKSFFFFVIGVVFAVISSLHFLRLMFEWQVFVGTWSIPGWISGMVFIFGIFITYWSIRLKREEESQSIDEPKDYDAETSQEE